MTVARIHHYIPRCYLKWFTRGRSSRSQLFAVDIVEKRSYWTSPRNVCAVRDFNRVDIPGQPPDVLENALARFDGELGAALQTIHSMRSLEDANARLVLLNFASLLATRNPFLRGQMEEFYSRLYQITGEMIVSTRERYDAIVAQMAKEGKMDGFPSIPYEQVRDFVRGGEYDLVFPHGYHVVAEFEAQDAVLRTMLMRRWTLLRAPSDAEFITSDLPICLWPSQHARQPVGHGLGNTTVLLPVTSSLLALGTFDGIEGSFDTTREHVAALNLGIAMRCDRLVFAKSEAFETADKDGQFTVGPRLIYRMIPSDRRPRAPKHAHMEEDG